MSRVTQVPIWGRPQPGSRRPRFSREQIASVALEIADQEGFDAVSMRRIASQLGAGTMSLYHYVQTKADLVALMDDALMGETLIPSDELPTGWQAAVAAIARRTRSVLIRHPWALTSLQDAQFGPNAMRHFEQFLEAVAGTNLAPTAKFEVLAVVNDYVFGNVLRVGESLRRAASAKSDPAAVKAAIEFGMAQLQTGQFPNTKALLGDADPSTGLASAPGPPMDESGTDQQFERGLRAVLDGLEARMGIASSTSLERRISQPAGNPGAERVQRQGLGEGPSAPGRRLGDRPRAGAGGYLIGSEQVDHIARCRRCRARSRSHCRVRC